MKKLVEYSTVRVVALYGPPEAHVVLTDSPTSPAVGDEGTIVHIISADAKTAGEPSAAGTRFIVESMASTGRTNWLAEFSSGELEPVDA